MKFSRRDFLSTTIKGACAVSLSLSAFKILSPKEAEASIKEANIRWGFVVDTEKCVGCGLCVKACKLENEVPYEVDVTRTWVERYVILKGGERLIDTPHGGREGFTSPVIDDREVNPKDIAKAFFVPKLCNQCENPPCVQVCPVGATYQTNDGIVLVDRKWCIGCGYCIMSCPYGARFYHPVHKVAEKCTFCFHRVRKGLKTACVDACPFGARMIGNFKNPNDPATRIIMTQRVGILKDAFGTKPQIYYLGMDENVR